MRGPRYGPNPGRSRAIGTDRGSRKRVRRIRLRDNWSTAVWIWFVFMALVIFVLLPWLMKHPPKHTHSEPFGASDGRAAPRH